MNKEFIIKRIQSLGMDFGGSSKIYIGGSLFSKSDQVFNKDIADIFESVNMNVYLPQEADINDKESTELITGKRIYDFDNSHLDTCDYMFAHYTDREDPGLCWEMARAIQKGIHVAAFYDDIRLGTIPNPDQNTENNQAMYFNQYVIGGIQSSLGGTTKVLDTILLIWNHYKKNILS